MSGTRIRVSPTRKLKGNNSEVSPKFSASWLVRLATRLVPKPGNYVSLINEVFNLIAAFITKSICKSTVSIKLSKFVTKAMYIVSLNNVTGIHADLCEQCIASIT